MIGLLVATLASAGTWGEASAVGFAPRATEARSGGAGVSGGVGVDLLRWLDLRATVQVGVDVRPRLRGAFEAGAILHGPRFEERGGPFIGAGAGGLIAEGTPWALGWGSVGLDLATRAPVRPRFEASFQFAPQRLGTALVRAGVRFGRRPRAPVPELVVDGESTGQPSPVPETPDPGSKGTVAEPVTAEPGGGVPAWAASPAEALVWAPHPVCDWVPASELPRLLAEHPEMPRVQVGARGYLPQWVGRAGVTTVALAPAPPQGALVVVAWPGDQVSLGEAPIPVGEDGVAMANVLEGRVSVTVRGGGRVQDLSGSVTEGHGLWVRATKPGNQVVYFDVGSEVPKDLALLAGVAGSLGRWGLSVAGSSSSEGDPVANAALAERRAQAVIEVLVTAGAPRDQLLIGPARVATGAPSAEQRVVTLTPLEPR